MSDPLRLKIDIQYLTGEWESLYSYHRPKFTDDGCILIKTDHGVVRYEKKDLMRLKTTTVFKKL